jgi:3-oxoacyl-[acyl-carrier protein] reductase
MEPERPDGDVDPTADANTRVALVTGGGRGIGAAISRRLAARGHPVAINYVSDGAAADRVAAEIRAAGGRAVTISADVANPADVDRLYERTCSELGAPAIVVNNAGRSAMTSARRQTPAEWDRTIAVNLSSAFYCTHVALDAMVHSGWGRIVVVSSPVAERTPLPGQSAYAAAKAGLTAMARSAALEMAGSGVTVNAVMPGYVETDMTQEIGDDGVAFMRRTWPQIPATAVADCVAFLTSDAAAHVSGEEIGVWLGGPVHRP